MRRWKSLCFLCLIMTFSLQVVFNLHSASAESKPDLMVTSIETVGSVYADQPFAYHIQVVSMDPANPKATEKKDNDATVTVYYRNSDNKLITSQPKLDGNGVYTGKVTLPDSGQWDVLVTALRKGEKEASDSSNVYTLTTQVAVHPPKTNGSFWAYGSILVGACLVILFLIALVRRRNRRTN